MAQTGAVKAYDRCQQSRATSFQEVPPQQVDAGGMRMMNNALRIPKRAVVLQLHLCVESHCRSAGHTFAPHGTERTKSDARRNQGLCYNWRRMSKPLCKTVCTVLQRFLETSATTAGTQLHAIKPNKILRFDFLYIGLSRDGKYKYYFSWMI
jgi:hypothetical protein